MYEDNNNNNSSFTNNENGYTQPQPQYNFTTEPPKPPKKKRHTAAIIISSVLAVAIIGTGSGFGGAYVAGQMMLAQEKNSASDNAAPGSDTTAADTTATEEIVPSTTEEYVKPEISVTADLSTLENMAAINTTVEYSAAELFEKVNQSIIIVNNYQYLSTSSYYGYTTPAAESDSTLTLYGTGSGVIITTDGYIITNYHVIQNAKKISVTINDGVSDDEEIEAYLVASDSSTDLAVLKVSREEAFTAAALGDSDGLKVGQTVCAIGNPAGLDKTISQGIVSGLNRYYTSDSGYSLSSIQTDTAINPGNSGGGLFDMYGNVIGIVNSKLVASDSSIENLGFAITINEAKAVISDLINVGYVTGRPLLGISTVELNEYAAYLYGFSTAGLFVSEINADAPVAGTDLKVGDIIVAINGTSVSSISDVQTILKNFRGGDTITASVVRVVASSGHNNKNTTENLDIEIVLTES